MDVVVVTELGMGPGTGSIPRLPSVVIRGSSQVVRAFASVIGRSDTWWSTMGRGNETFGASLMRRDGETHCLVLASSNRDADRPAVNERRPLHPVLAHLVGLAGRECVALSLGVAGHG